eukprot:9673329-Ditylum_brightwellii.AAC.1
MVQANLHITNYNELVMYYGSLKAVKPKDGNNKNNNNYNNKNKKKLNNQNSKNNNNNKGSNNNQNGNFKPCHIHGNKHDNQDCCMQEQICQEGRNNGSNGNGNNYQNNNQNNGTNYNNRNTGNGNGNRNNNSCSKDKNNNIRGRSSGNGKGNTSTHNTNISSNSNRNFLFSEANEDLNNMFNKIHTISDMLRDHAMEEKSHTNPPTITNQHEDMDGILSHNPPTRPTTFPKAPLQPASASINNKDVTDNLSTKTIIKMTTNEGHMKNILSLLNIGAIGKIGAFIKHDALKSIPHTIKHIDGKIQGCYATEDAKEVATFDIKLPELCHSKTVTISAYVEDNTKG